MQTYQYTCARRDPDGTLTVLELLTPPKVAETPTEALNQLAEWFTTNNCVPYKRVR